MALTNRQKMFIDAYISSMFYVAKACRTIQISRRTYYDWLEDSKEFKEAIAEAEQARKDFIENQAFVLAKGIPITDRDTGEVIGWEEKPDSRVVVFLNETVNKDRGYIKRSEVENLPSRPEDRLDLSKLSVEERISFLELQEKMLNKDENPK